MTAIRRTSILILLLAFLVSTNGIAIYHHICGCGEYKSNQSAMVSASEPASCCCSLPHESACCEGYDHKACTSKDHKGCRNEVIYLKAEIVSTPPSPDSFHIKPCELFLSYFWINPFIRDTEISGSTSEFSAFSILPPSAPAYIRFHHIRIPLPEDYC